jgi:hypothetical protein
MTSPPGRVVEVDSDIKCLLNKRKKSFFGIIYLYSKGPWVIFILFTLYPLAVGIHSIRC